MNNVCLHIAYEGSSFFGWQKTKAGPSVEETLQIVLETILQEPIQLQAASRTDRGVHAEGQVVNFITHKPPPLKISLNQLLPRSIRVLEVKVMPSAFHPTIDATSKRYTYCICFGSVQLPFYRYFSWHVPGLLNLTRISHQISEQNAVTGERFIQRSDEKCGLELMKKAAGHLIGNHDFSAFCNVHENLKYPNKRRCIDDIEMILLETNRLQIAIRGNCFLYKMVRTLVGTLVYVGLGKIKADAIPDIIASKKRSEAGITAPARGLTLKEVYFGKI